jgi:hypothetical protein
MTDLFAIPSERVGKLIRLALGSNSPGECFAAIDAIRRTLANGGIDSHWLAAVVEKAWPIPSEPSPKPSPKPQREPDPKKPWQAFAEELLLRHPEVIGMRGKKLDPALRAKEVDFLTNMRNSRIAPTAFQEKWMNDVANRIRRAA